MKTSEKETARALKLATSIFAEMEKEEKRRKRRKRKKRKYSDIDTKS